MPLKIGNVTQAKVGQLASTDTTQKTLFTLPAQAQIVNVFGFSANDASGVVTLYARPISQLTPVAFATIALAAAAGGVLGTFTSATIPYSRQSEPVVISAAITTGPTGTPSPIVRVDFM